MIARRNKKEPSLHVVVALKLAITGYKAALKLAIGWLRRLQIFNLQGRKERCEAVSDRTRSHVSSPPEPNRKM